MLDDANDLVGPVLGSAPPPPGIKPTADGLVAVIMPAEDGSGLFQFNRRNGQGKGFAVEQRTDPRFITNRTIVAIQKRIPEFGRSATLADAVDIFVRRFERPADPAAAVAQRRMIAKRLLSFSLERMAVLILCRCAC